jgi:hypothetical protein
MKETHIFLTGGLGNQLFQWAAGISRGNENLILDFGIGRPRLNKQGKPDISDFNIEEVGKLGYLEEYNWFFRKFSGYVLRIGMAPTRLEKFLRFQNLASIALGLCLFTRYGKFVKVIQATDNGFFQMKKQTRNEYLVGYFQSYRWPELEVVNQRLKSLKLLRQSAKLNQFIEQNSPLDTVMVHVRLGDYKDHQNFGIPSPKYYKQALAELLRFQPFERILLFSNEPDSAMDYIPSDLLSRVLIAPDFDGSAAETLEAMRHAKSYIIGNSTLSWWGAKLSYSANPKVIAPNPWFKTEPEPKDLIPPDWIRIDAFDKN